jgi:hypothetical protein
MADHSCACRHPFSGRITAGARGSCLQPTCAEQISGHLFIIAEMMNSILPWQILPFELAHSETRLAPEHGKRTSTQNGKTDGTL